MLLTHTVNTSAMMFEDARYALHTDAGRADSVVASISHPTHVQSPKGSSSYVSYSSTTGITINTTAVVHMYRAEAIELHRYSCLYNIIVDDALSSLFLF